MSEGKDNRYEDDSYPDLDLDSEDNRQQPDILKKKVKPNEEVQQKPILPAKSAKSQPPPMMGLPFSPLGQTGFPLPFMPGMASFPLPPPGQKRPPEGEASNPHQNPQKSFNSTHRMERKDSTGQGSNKGDNNFSKDRKNILYVKNIPKCYNTSEKLMTLFRNYGNIKQVKSNQQACEATVRFRREQDASRFVTADTKIFNRTYILSSLDANFVVPEKLVKERENDQMGAARRPVEVEIRQMKEQVQENALHKFRALLFLHRYLADPNLKLEVEKLIDETKKFKGNISNLTDQEAKQISSEMMRDYDWTTSAISDCKQVPTNKKQLISLFQKYGPISTLNFSLVELEEEDREKKYSPVAEEDKKITPGQEEQLKIQAKPSQPNGSEIPEQQKQPTNQVQKPIKLLIKIRYLAPKSAWKMFLDYQSNELLKDETLIIEGSKMKALFNSGQLKTPEEVLSQKRTEKTEIKREEKAPVKQETGSPSKDDITVGFEKKEDQAKKPEESSSKVNEQKGASE